MINEKCKEWIKENMNRINILKTKNKEVNLELEKFDLKKYPIKKEEIKDINIDIKSLNLQLEAPIFCNEKIAEVQVCVKENEILRTNILIVNDIKRKNVFDYFCECLISIMSKKISESI